MTVSVHHRAGQPTRRPPRGRRSSATVARLIFERAVPRVPVRVSYPDGRVLGARLVGRRRCSSVVRPSAFFARLGRDTKIGFGEAYMAGDWRAGTRHRPGRPADAVRRAADHPGTPAAAAAARPRRQAHPAEHENTARRVAREHRRPLRPEQRPVRGLPRPDDELLLGVVRRERPVDSATDLEEAQLRKIDAILDLAGVGAGTRVLEIGTGWGALAIRAAQRGARVTTVTLSPEQLQLAQRAGRGRRPVRPVDVRLQDYREVAGQFDAIVSVEMIEAVGEEYWPTYFATLDRLLAPGGSRQHPGDHHGARPAPCHPAQLRLDPEVHLPRRPDPVAAGDRRHPRCPHDVAGGATPGAACALRADPAPVAGAVPRRSGRSSAPRASTRPSAGCGSSTSPTARPASAAATSASASCSSCGQPA